MELKALRESKKLTQTQAAETCGISVRSYKSYENDMSKRGTIKYSYLMDTLSKYNAVDEEHGVLSIEEIKELCTDVFTRYNVQYCYLFGSYAKRNADGSSDIDLLIGSSLTGIKFYALVEELRQKLQKRVDALSVNQLNGNPELTNEVLMDGIKIYG